MSDIEEETVDDKRGRTDEDKNKEMESFSQKHVISWWGEIKSTIIFIVGLLVLCGAIFLVLFFLEEFTRDRTTLDRFVRIYKASLSTETCDANLKNITQFPHHAGTEQGKILGEWMGEKLESLLGKDNPRVTVKTETYEVLLPFPTQESALSFTAKDNSRTYHATLSEPESPAKDLTSLSFIGYSASGNLVNADLVYANYGTKDDFEALEAKGIVVSGKLVICRYGKIFRGLKVRLAEKAGAVGVVLYSDPADDGESKGKVYPEGPWRPFSSIQRGSSMYMDFQPGDPTTPGFASLPGTRNRLTRAQATNLPKIPVTAISAKDAFEFLKTLGGETVEASWKGSFEAEGFEYRYGSPTGNTAFVNMNIKMDEKMSTIYNVFAKVEGEVESDRIVMVGNHRDSWVKGATDPHSGTIAMLEMAKGLGEMMKSGYAPRRSVVFASWDAEEQGLIGSTEYVEQYKAQLENQMVAYVNLDTMSGVGAFRAIASPSLSDVVRDAAKGVEYPKGFGNTTERSDVFEEWKKQFNGSQPKVSYVGSGSDYTAFFHHAGISVIDLAFTETKGTFGAYHSRYDDYAYYSSVIDPGFTICKAISEVAGRALLRLADDIILPFRMVEQAQYIKDEFDNLLVNEINDFFGTFKSVQVKSFNETIAMVVRTISEFESAAETSKKQHDVIHSLTEQSKNYEIRVRKYNDAVMRAERGFAVQKGLPGRSWYKHVISAPGVEKGYGYELFPAVREALRAKDAEKVLDALSVVNEGIAASTSIISGAFSGRNTQ